MQLKKKRAGLSVCVPPYFLLETTRAREWDGVVTCHAGLPFAHTWNLNNAIIGRHRLASKHMGVNAKPMVSLLPFFQRLKVLVEQMFGVAVKTFNPKERYLFLFIYFSVLRSVGVVTM